MSFIYNYISTIWKSEEEINNKNIYHSNENVEKDYSLVDKKYLISKEDLEKINLKPVSNIIPNPSRNMPYIDIVNLQSLNKAQLNMIMNVKLKPSLQNTKPSYYEPKHPVLKELLDKFKCKNI
jgi:hypothetical protein